MQYPINVNHSFINIHAHIKNVKAFQNFNFTLYNLDATEFSKYEKDVFYSAGIHPWYIKEDWLLYTTEQIVKLKYKNVLAVGECGLDKNIAINFELQKVVFQCQIALANKFEKPLIIHCVKAYQEVLFELKNMQNNMPVIFHGFNKNTEIAKSIIDAGYYISVGKSIMNSNNKNKDVLKTIPIEKLFLETDDSNFSIENIYESASKIVALPTNKLKQQIITNFKKVFQII